MPLIGQPKDTPIPPELNKWNWGAFLLNWIWGAGNKTYIALLSLIPFVGIVFIFILGAKGNKWAWENEQWYDLDHFKKTQRNWSIAGFWVVVGSVVMIFITVFSILVALSNTDAYKIAVDAVRKDQNAITALGEPIETKWYFFGGVEEYNGSGKAALIIPVSGSKCDGVVFSHSNKSRGVWTLDTLFLDTDCSDEKMVLIE